MRRNHLPHPDDMKKPQVTRAKSLSGLAWALGLVAVLLVLFLARNGLKLILFFGF